MLERESQDFVCFVEAILNKKLFLILTILMFVFLIVFSFVQAKIGFENPVPPLPNDNLLSFNESWFRDETTVQGGFSNWVNVAESAAISRGANKNPSPDGNDGTAVQWDNETGCAPLKDCIVYLNVAAPQPHNVLKFSWWNVVVNMDLYQLAIYGCENNLCQNRTLVSIQEPLNQGPIWGQSDHLLIETAVSYPAYQLEITCRYHANSVFGCKATGIYFAVVQDTNIIPPTPTATFTPAPTETPDPISSPNNLIFLPVIKKDE